MCIRDSPKGDDSPASIANERLARGEISIEDHSKLLATIKSARESTSQPVNYSKPSDTATSGNSARGSNSVGKTAAVALALGGLGYLLLDGGTGSSILGSHWTYEEEQTSRGAKMSLVGIPSETTGNYGCLLYTSPSPRDLSTSRMPSSA